MQLSVFYTHKIIIVMHVIFSFLRDITVMIYLWFYA